ncbi:MAG: Ribosomal silencing factor RsfS [Chlamydiia bacterium]|nr:Ribosomal silencing factor RsfS [Chlamydiia bacterium]
MQAEKGEELIQEIGVEKKEEILNQIAQVIYDKKGSNIVCLDVSHSSPMTDHIIIAEGNVNRHIVAIAHEIISEFKKQGKGPVHVNGMEHGEWVVIDFIDTVVHIFHPDMREHYDLENLYEKSRQVDLELKDVS